MKKNKISSYENFNVSVYCPVGNIMDIADFEEFNNRFELLEKNMKIGKVYLECYRDDCWITKEQLVRVKEFFEAKGIRTAGGITTNNAGDADGFHPFCYTSSSAKETLRKAVIMNAEVFEEFIFDDFYFTNCRCKNCIDKKGKRTWAQFRTELLKEISEEIVMKTAKEINPDVNVIIKFPNWYEAFQETGYNLEEEPKIFDEIYTGCETRNPTYAQQHLPKYLSFFTMRYFENVAPGRNMGGWFDPYECTYNISSYLEQAYFTLFGKSKEVMLYSLGSLIDDTDYQTFPPALGQVFAEADAYIGELGEPTGVATYLPYHSVGEDNIHNYLGMCGIPFNPHPEYPEEEKVIFLAEGAACDQDIVSKMQKSLALGADVIVTSGFVRKLGEAFLEFMNVSYSARKALVQEYGYSKDGGLSISGKADTAEKILIPQMDYYTNDVWELAAAYGTDNNFPLLLRSCYNEGRVFVVTIPDNIGDIYFYPKEILNIIREAFCRESLCRVSGPSKVALFLFDNHTAVVRSDLPYYDSAELILSEKNVRVKVIDMIRKKELPVTQDNKVILNLAPGVNYVLKIEK